MEQIRVVTDSTADIPDELAQELDISVIYDYINFGTQSLRDKIDISRVDFYRRLADQEQPTTAAPGVGEFLQAYQHIAAPNVHIISLHPSAHLSALYNTARLAARDLGPNQGQFHAVDSGQLSMGIGWQAIKAARAARQGHSAKEILDQLEAMQARVYVFAVLDSLDFLRRSGRVSWARAALGTLLSIKPIISVRYGQIIALDRVRTTRRAQERLIKLVKEIAPLESLAILHTNIPAKAEKLYQHLRHLCPNNDVLTVDVTPVIGAHTGPNSVGIAAVSAET